jgi:iron complex transport system substrate-binding protein
MRREQVERRVVSLLPSTTEIVAELGHTDALVGRSHECDHPPEVSGLPVVSRPRRDPVGTSAEIHRGVLELLEQVLSIYEVDTEALQRADPDLIITQDLCRVCAVAEDEVVEAARTHLGGEVDVLTSSPLTLDEVFEDVRRIGAALDDPGSAERLVARMRSDLDELATQGAGRARPRLALIEWADPLMTGGHWAPELISLAGAEPVLANPGGHAPQVTPGELLVTDPDVILIAPCGYDLARAQQEHEVLTALPEWDQLAAVRTGRVAYADGSAYFSRPGPRLVTSAQIIAAVAHGVGPGTALEGLGWQRAG